jgi:hypothetical protein
MAATVQTLISSVSLTREAGRQTNQQRTRWAKLRCEIARLDSCRRRSITYICNFPLFLYVLHNLINYSKIHMHNSQHPAGMKQQDENVEVYRVYRKPSIEGEKHLPWRPSYVLYSTRGLSPRILSIQHVIIYVMIIRWSIFNDTIKTCQWKSTQCNNWSFWWMRGNTV